MMNEIRALFIIGFSFLLASFLVGCAIGGGAGISVRQVDPEEPGRLRCLGLENHDIIKISRDIVEDIRRSFLDRNSGLIEEGRPIRIIVDSETLRNETDQVLNMNMLADQLSVHLQRASNERVAFLSREDMALVEAERALKRSGEVDKGALGLVDKIAGADYRLTGRLTAQQRLWGMEDRHEVATVFSLWLVDLETGAKVWSWATTLIKEGIEDDAC